MKLHKTVTTTAAALLITSSVLADGQNYYGTPWNSQMNPRMLDPVMMDNMMRMPQQPGQGPHGSMNTNMMDPVMMQNMRNMRQQQMAQGQDGNMPMGGGQHGMMNPQMMQNMMQMRQQHMTAMEQRLANIESMLTDLIELQKKK